MDKVVFLTGGTSGIGEALVDIFLNKNYLVFTCGKNPRRVSALKQKYIHFKERLVVHLVDISDSNQSKKWIEDGLHIFGGIDILLLNAGISMQTLAEHAHPSVHEKIMNVNFFANIRLVHESLPSLIQSKGIIISISSVASMIGLPGRTAYSASKAALHRWMDALRKELLHHQVAVLVFSPGYVATDIRQKALDEHGEAIQKDGKMSRKMMSAELCAEKIFKAIQKKKILSREDTFFEKCIVFLNAHFPKWVDRLIAKAYIKNKQLIQ